MDEIKFYSDSNDYGTEHYYQTPLFRGFVYTDGVKHMAEKFGAYWLIDAVASHIPAIKRADRDETFYVVTCILDGNGGCTLTARRDSDQPSVIEQKIDYTDLTENVKMYLAFEGPRSILLMPTEY